MSDVTCKATHTFLDVVAQRGVDPALLAERTNYSLEFLRDKNNRITWSEFVHMGRAMRELCNLTDGDLEEVGRQAFKSGPLRVVMSLGRVLGEPARFYKWMQRGNAMLFANMTSHVEVHAKNQLSIRITLREQDEPSTEYLAVSKGAIASMPTLLGYPEANVVLHIRGPEAVFEVSMAPRRRSYARRVMHAFRGNEETADELLATNQALTKRLAELSHAHEQIREQAVLLDQQASRLRLANEVAALIHGALDPQETLDRIGRTLLSNTRAIGVQLEVQSQRSSAPLRANRGVYPAFVHDSTIHARGLPVGRLKLHTVSDEDRDELANSLEYVLPVLGMAIENALAYHELAEYKAGLEKLVEDRTAELRTAHDELAGLVGQLREALAGREKFFGNISHEIRTPLSLILLAAADIERRSGHVMDDRSKGGLGAVNDGARKLVRLVDELLLLAAGQEGKLVVAREPTDLAGLIKQIVDAWRPAAEAAGLQLSGTAPHRFVANVDPVALERVVSNLVSNAVKYTPRGGQVDLHLATTGEQVRISVSDTGPGIDAELAQRLFGRFERAAGDDRRKVGTGIGLSLVKQLVEAHDGTVEAIARPTGGTEFRVVLPGSIAMDNVVALGAAKLRTHHAPDAGSTSITSGTVFQPTGLSAGTILVAEDQPRLAESIAMLLSEQYTVIVALDGHAALELVQQHQPQLLITDVEMPGMTGIELAAKFREATGDVLAPIIILSAVIDLRTRVAGLEAGAVDYVNKPFAPSELKARVQAQFRMRDLAMRLHRAEQLSAMGILTSGLAHELRNPANGIVNAIAPLTEMLPPELVGPETDVGLLLDAMKSSAEQIAFLVRQLLGFRNKSDLELRPTELASLVQRAITLARDAMTGVEMRTNLAFDRRGMCAAPLLVQVISNLVENAGHAAGRGGWVEIRGMTVGGRIRLEVTDSGPGVPLELRERIFEPFFTTKSPGKGTGLGLSVARAILHRHQGTLEVADRDGRTAFVLDLPGEIDRAANANAV